MNEIYIPVSAGELIDKISILHIKLEKIPTKSKLPHIAQEIEKLKAVCRASNINLEAHLPSFIEVNKELWEVLQHQRDKETKGELDENFIALSLQVYKLNDARFVHKQEIDQLYDSQIQEEKYYQ
jgi:hypothetical protein